MLKNTREHGVTNCLLQYFWRFLCVHHFFNFLRTSSDFLFVRKQKTLKFKKINKENLNSGRILHVLTSHKCFLFVIKKTFIRSSNNVFIPLWVQWALWIMNVSKTSPKHSCVTRSVQNIIEFKQSKTWVIM